MKKIYEDPKELDKLLDRVHNLAKLHTYTVINSWGKGTQTTGIALLRDGKQRDPQTLTDEEMSIYNIISCQGANFITGEASKRGLVPPPEHLP